MVARHERDRCLGAGCDRGGLRDHARLVLGRQCELVEAAREREFRLREVQRQRRHEAGLRDDLVDLGSQQRPDDEVRAVELRLQIRLLLPSRAES